MSLALPLYRLTTGLLEPFAPMLLRSRAKRGKEDLSRMRERLGRPSAPRPDGPLVWLHGASVGESLSILPLLAAFRRARPELQLLVTSGTVTSAELMARRLPEGVIHQFVPVDAPGAARRFLRHWRPDLAVFVESELWPNLMLGAARRGAGLALVSARLSEESVKGWAKAPAAARKLVGAYGLVLPQDEETAARLKALGARDDGRLNLKLAGEPLPVHPPDLVAAQAAAGDRPVLLAASTHPGEEAQVLDAFAQLPSDRGEPLLVIVPRHPARGGEIVELARARGYTAARRTEARFGQTRVYVADTLGELGLWFRLARASVIGGSLVPGIGGHNPLEPARLNQPACSGLHVDNWRGVYEALARENAIAFVKGSRALASYWRRALDGHPALDQQAERALRFAAGQGEALDDAVRRMLALIR